MLRSYHLERRENNTKSSFLQKITYLIGATIGGLVSLTGLLALFTVPAAALGVTGRGDGQRSVRAAKRRLKSRMDFAQTQYIHLER